ncbi:MAG: hypothetical protein DRI73_04000 [Bacteroidetes bacterium]|nr:MAG: hypothetical protein DRI73_04000 [Bacteroidota bacterium]
MRRLVIILILGIYPFFLFSQKLVIPEKHYCRIHATKDDPLYTTYAASMERSRLYGDKAYKMDYYSAYNPINYSSDHAGKIALIWMVDKLAMMSMNQFYEKPIVIASFPDMAIMEYQPMKGIKVQETFFVYSSTLSIVNLHIENTDTSPHTIDLFPLFELGKDSLEITRFDEGHSAYVCQHYETKKRLISNLYVNEPYPTNIRDIFTVNFKSWSNGGYKGPLEGFYNQIKTDWYDENRQDSLNLATSGFVNYISIQGRFILKPGETADIRFFKGWQGQNEDINKIFNQIEELKHSSLQFYLDANLQLFESVPKINFKSEDEKLIYLGALNLARSCMLPPTGKASENFYVFSREPKWGWGHGHQVLHESLSMIAYAYLDPVSAQNSQRIYMNQQGKDGLIAYRHGPRGMQSYEHNGKPTTSAPFFSWINWEVYKVSKDKTFLEDAYTSGSKYVKWLEKNRDTDKDGTFEWGPYGLIENVRDWYNVIFQVSKERHLDIDKEDISDELECLDLSLMVIKEMRSLSSMAKELGNDKDARKWKKKADKISGLINEIMWDEESGFYYHVDKKNHEFQFMGRDLKRPEIIGFLPLWAEAAPKDRADRLIQRLTDPNQFWRKYGVPTLSAEDSFYNPNVDYCCKWNGPVWLLWDYMVFEGLVNYGYTDIARELGQKMILAVKTQLSLNHNYWESYSPDNEVLNSPSNYIWDAIMAKLLIELSVLDEQ